MSTIYTRCMTSPIGPLTLCVSDTAVLKIKFQASDAKEDHPLIEWCDKELKAYFENPDHIFTLPIELSGTHLQQNIWRALQTIPRGDTLTYGALANTLLTHPRIIGNACRANPLPIIFPCHRVIARVGLGGFAGDTHGHLLQIKINLLAHERKPKQNML